MAPLENRDKSVRFLTYKVPLVVILMLLLNLAITFITFHRRSVALSWVTHTYDIITHLQSARTALDEAESWQRGYILLNRQQELTQYKHSAIVAHQELDAVTRLIQDDQQPEQEHRLRNLEDAVAVKIGELAVAVEAHDKFGGEAALRIISGETSLRSMENARLINAEMIDVEYKVLNQRQRTLTKLGWLFVGSVVLASFISAILLILLGRAAFQQYMREIEVLKQVEQEREWATAMLSSIGDAVMATDNTGRITFANPVAEHVLMLHKRDLLGTAVKPILTLVNEKTGASIENPVEVVLRTQKPYSLPADSELLRSDGSKIPVDDCASPIFTANHEVRGVVVVFRDMSQQRHVDEVLKRTEQLATVGRLSASIAHEINNPLEAVTNLVYLAQRDTGCSEAVKGYLQSVEQELIRITNLTKQSLGFYRESAKPSEVNLSLMLPETLELYKHKLTSNRVVVERNIDPDCLVWAVSGEVRQVVSNLIVNALDAMPGGGRLTIGCIRQDTRVAIVVQDTGTGIPEEVAAHIFQPFYTTKAGTGTGLGLWVVESLVEKNRGTITFQTSTVPKLSGTRFEVTFPVPEK